MAFRHVRSARTRMNRATIVVTARERFELTIASLEDIYKTADVDFDLVYVDVRSPRRTSQALRAAAVRYGFRLVRLDHFVSPNAARNIGVRYAEAPYVVFVDNDVFFEPGWLSSLVHCAEETGAWVVGPLYMDQDGRSSAPRVHMAGGDMEFSGSWGAREFVQTQRYFGQPLEAVPPESMVRQECDIIEFHCALFRNSALEKVGPFDEDLLTTREHLDYCLRNRELGGTIYFEPSSVVLYRVPPPLQLTDLPYFSLRWSDVWTRHTLVHFAEKYGITPSYEQRVAKTRKRRQRILLAGAEDRLTRILGDRISAPLLGGLRRVEPVMNRLMVRLLTPNEVARRLRRRHLPDGSPPHRSTRSARLAIGWHPSDSASLAAARSSPVDTSRFSDTCPTSESPGSRT